MALETSLIFGRHFRPAVVKHIILKIIIILNVIKSPMINY